MVATDRVKEIFTDARTLQSDALEMLALGEVRNAAEKAWGATKRATDALVLARAGEEPELPAATAEGLRQLQAGDDAVRQARLVPATTPAKGPPPRSLLLHGAVRPSGGR